MNMLKPLKRVQKGLTYIVKVGYDFVEKTQALLALPVNIAFVVELGEARDRGKHDCHIVERFCVHCLLMCPVKRQAFLHI